jgi:hypothetical protein
MCLGGHHITPPPQITQRLFSLAAELCNSAGVMPKLNIVPINHFEGAFLCSVVIGAGEVDCLNVVAVTANKVRLIIGRVF